MKQLSKIVVPVTLLAIGCGNVTGPIAIDPGSLAGTWNARSYGFINKANLSEAVDLVGRGASLVITFTSDGNYTWDFQDVDGETTSVSGTFTTDDPLLTFSDVGEGTPEPFFAVRNDDNLKLATGNAEFDFNEDDVLEEAQWEIFLVRN
jgi:hypothetical protein